MLSSARYLKPCRLIPGRCAACLHPRDDRIKKKKKGKSAFHFLLRCDPQKSTSGPVGSPLPIAWCGRSKTRTTVETGASARTFSTRGRGLMPLGSRHHPVDHVSKSRLDSIRPPPRLPVYHPFLPGRRQKDRERARDERNLVASRERSERFLGFLGNSGEKSLN